MKDAAPTRAESEPANDFRRWLSTCGLSKEDFVETYYQKFPFAAGGNLKSSSALCSWDSIVPLLVNPKSDVMVCRENLLYEGLLPQSAEGITRLCDLGYTFLVRHAEHHDDELARLARSFSAEFLGAVNVHVYVTPPHNFGFGWHYDAEDVFIFQTQGQKEYSLRKNTVNPWPVVDAIPQDMGYERELMPLMRCSLKRGDWLYIPAGYWHKAEAKELSISIAVGVLSPTVLDIFDFARRQLIQSLAIRQRLPHLQASDALSDRTESSQLRECVVQLKQEFARVLDQENFLGQFLEHAQAK